MVGERKIETTLTNYRDAIRFVFNRTIEGMNKGLTPNQPVDFVKLPEKYQKPYYGHPDWAVCSIFNGYLGWFDGNPTNLFPLSDKAEAEQMAIVPRNISTNCACGTLALRCSCVALNSMFSISKLNSGRQFP